MANKIRYKTGFGFIDLLFNLLVGFTFMFILAFILINPVAKKDILDPKAEYLIVMTWDDKSPYDIDAWTVDNQNNIVSFRSKDLALIHLDRDDLGLTNDFERLEDGTVEQRYVNREVVSLRSAENRTYWVSAHWFSCGFNCPKDKSIDVKFEVFKVNPFMSLKTKTVTLTSVGEEIPVFEIIVKDGWPEIKSSKKPIIYDMDRIRKTW